VSKKRNGEQEAQMWSRLGQGAPAGSFTLKLPRSQGQKAREVTLSVRFSRVTIAVPKHKAKYLKMDTPVEASNVELREENAPKGKSICWRLLSTLEVDTLEAAIDAMGGHPAIAQLIADAGADYILALKANEQAAHQAVAAQFASQRSNPTEIHATGTWAAGCEVSTTREQNRGRYEQREVVVLRETSWWPKSWKWAGLQSIICVRRETMRQRHPLETPTVEMHYYLSSSKADATELGRLIRNHWSVENQCHHLLDVT